VQVEVQVQEKLQMKVQLMQVVEGQLEGEEKEEGDFILGSAFKCDVSVVTCYGTFVTLVI
jgi:hypothetical protein